MINKIHYYLHRPEKGWDPIKPVYGKQYADYEWEHFDPKFVDQIEEKVSSLRNKTVLDLGAGPGHYSAEFARRGAFVTWFDISKFYQDYARRRIENESLSDHVTFGTGYLEESLHLGMQFDLVFNRICFCYSINDFEFARVITKLIKDGGNGFIMTNHLGFLKKTDMSMKIKVFLNESLGWKIGHPHCSKKRLQEAFALCDLNRIEYDFDTSNAYIFLRK